MWVAPECVTQWRVLSGCGYWILQQQRHCAPVGRWNDSIVRSGRHLWSCTWWCSFNMRCWAMRRKAHFKNNTQFIDLGDRFMCIFPIYFYCDVEMAIGKWSSRPAVLWEIQDRISVVWPIFWQCETALVSLPASTSSLCAIDAPKTKSNWHENC